MAVDRERVVRGRVAFMQVQNSIIDRLNEHVCPKGSPSINRSDVPDLRKPVDELLKQLSRLYEDISEEREGIVEVPCLCYGRHPTLDPRRLRLDEWTFFIRRFVDLGYGWTCTECGQGEAVETAVCRNCGSRRVDQLEHVEPHAWRDDYVDPIERNLEWVEYWFQLAHSPLKYVLLVDVPGLSAKLNGQSYGLPTKTSALVLQQLLKRPGDWVTSKEMRNTHSDLDGSRVDRFVKRLPKPIHALIERKTGSGYRLRLHLDER